MNDLTRRAMRFPAQVTSVEIIARYTAWVVDESQTGIAIAVEGPCAFGIGQQVEIDYDGATTKAVVRRVDPQADGSHIVGLQWA